MTEAELARRSQSATWIPLTTVDALTVTYARGPRVRIDFGPCALKTAAPPARRQSRRRLRWLPPALLATVGQDSDVKGVARF